VGPINTEEAQDEAEGEGEEIVGNLGLFLINDPKKPEIDQNFQILANKLGSLLDADGDATGEDWNDVTFEGDWVNYGGSYGDVKYYKHGDIVYFQGLANNPTLLTEEDIMFILPANYRPSNHAKFAVPSIGDNPWVIIKSDGTVSFDAGSNVKNVTVSLEGIFFRL